MELVTAANLSRSVIRLHPLEIRARSYFLYPGLVIQIPAHRLAQSRSKGLLRPPPQLTLSLSSVDGVAAIVAGTVGDVGEQLRMRPMRRVRQKLIQQRAQHLDGVQIGLLVPS